MYGSIADCRHVRIYVCMSIYACMHVFEYRGIWRLGICVCVCMCIEHLSASVCVYAYIMLPTHTHTRATPQKMRAPLDHDLREMISSCLGRAAASRRPPRVGHVNYGRSQMNELACV